MFVAPVLATALLLGSWRRSKATSRAVVIGLLASSYVLLVGLVISKQSQAGAEMSWVETRDSTEQGLRLILGPGPRRWLALFGLLALPAVLSRSSPQRGLAGYVLVVVVALLHSLGGQSCSSGPATRSARIRCSWRFNTARVRYNPDFASKMREAGYVAHEAPRDFQIWTRR